MYNSLTRDVSPILSVLLEKSSPPGDMMSLSVVSSESKLEVSAPYVSMPPVAPVVGTTAGVSSMNETLRELVTGPMWRSMHAEGPFVVVVAYQNSVRGPGMKMFRVALFVHESSRPDDPQV